MPGILGPVTNCTLEVVDAIWTCSGPFPVHTPYLFSSCFLRTHFYRFLALFSHAAKAKPLLFDYTAWHGGFWRFNGLFIPCPSSPPICLPHPPPHPPYNPRFIVYFMTIIPLRLITILGALFSAHGWFSSLSTHHILLSLLHHDAQDSNSLLVSTSQLPSSSGCFHSQSHSSPFNSRQRIPLTSFHHNGTHIAHLLVFSKL